MLALGLVACGDDDDDNPTEPEGPGTISEIARQDARLTTLVAALEAAGLDESLETSGPFTVFAPVNEAFDGLPLGWFANLLLPENEDILTKILSYHVVAGAAFSTDLTDGQALTTLEGTALTVNIAGGTITISDASGKDVDIVEADIEASNGVLHPTREIFVPELDVVEVARISGYSTLVSLVETAGLTETLEGEGPFTIFAPNNLAFEGLVAPEGEALTDLLTYHVVADELLAADLTDGQVLTTEQGEDITVNIDGTTVTITDANGNVSTVSRTDLVGSNGVIHGLEAVLLPAATIPEVASIYGYSGLVDALVAAGLDEALAGSSWTVFAPTNEVFEGLPVDGDGNPVIENPLLSNILTYHAIEGDPIFSGDLTDGQVATMANGDEVTVSIDEGTGAVTLTDELGNMVGVTATDIRASNGVIHEINGLLTPSLDMVDVATLNGFTTLVDLAVTAGLEEALRAPEANLTVFAPTNEAFAALSEVPEGEALTEVLLYHALPAIRDAASFTIDGEQIATAQGDVVTVVLDGENVTLTDGQGNTVNVTAVDVAANNGLIHVIDAVLLPPTPEAGN
jgi:uncharacterized surface protein with fasciclin (FAS1) repeats